METEIASNLEELMQNKSFLSGIIKIQKAWRRKAALKYLMGHRIRKDYINKTNLWNNVLHSRYHATQNAESEFLQHETHHQRELANVENYFFK